MSTLEVLLCKRFETSEWMQEEVVYLGNFFKEWKCQLWWMLQHSPGMWCKARKIYGAERNKLI